MRKFPLEPTLHLVNDSQCTYTLIIILQVELLLFLECV